MNFRAMGGSGGQATAAPQTPLTRQGSIYALTFDEFQSTLGGTGKEFGSLNMDELLKNIWTAEEGYAMTTALGEASGGVGFGIQRQGSLTLPRTLSQKTVDEVWRDLVGPNSSSQLLSAGGAEVPRQPTLGEITLEEFLVRAGVVREELPPSQTQQMPAANSSTSTNICFGDLSAQKASFALTLEFNQGSNRSNGNLVAPVPQGSASNLGMTRLYEPTMPLGISVDLGNPLGTASGRLDGFSPAGLRNRMTGMAGLGAAGVTKASGSPMNPLPSDGIEKGNGDMSSVSPVPYVFSGEVRGRKSGGVIEKVMERRQRRMIKNRESAARSRARKQVILL